MGPWPPLGQMSLHYLRSYVVQMQTRQLWAVKLQMMGICPVWVQESHMKKNEGRSSVAMTLNWYKVTAALDVKAGPCPCRSEPRMLRGQVGPQERKALLPDTLEPTDQLRRRNDCSPGPPSTLEKATESVRTPWDCLASSWWLSMFLADLKLAFSSCLQNPATISQKHDEPP